MIVAGLLFLAMPSMVNAQSGNPPPVAPPLVREGEFAVKMALSLGVATTEDEVEAETKLGEVGITPRNGWIADYPVTPDIIGELQNAVSNAADSGKLSLPKDEALKRLYITAAEFGVSIKSYVHGEASQAKPPGADNYQNSTIINDYYYSSGPPVVTYYSPPPAYYYLYSWVPYPFWWLDFWFPGFYVLNDFHRVVVVNHHRTVFISNHFNDIRHNRVFRIDPVRRYHGTTYSGIGVSHPKRFLSTGVSRSPRTIFNKPHDRTMPGRKIVNPPSQGSRVDSPPLQGRVNTPATREKDIVKPPSRGSGTAIQPSKENRREVPPSRGEYDTERGKRR
jgi:hypothetical protein